MPYQRQLASETKLWILVVRTGVLGGALLFGIVKLGWFNDSPASMLYVVGIFVISVSYIYRRAKRERAQRNL